MQRQHPWCHLPASAPRPSPNTLTLTDTIKQSFYSVNVIPHHISVLSLFLMSVMLDMIVLNLGQSDNSGRKERFFMWNCATQTDPHSTTNKVTFTHQSLYKKHYLWQVFTTLMPDKCVYILLNLHPSNLQMFLMFCDISSTLCFSSSIILFVAIY